MLPLFEEDPLETEPLISVVIPAFEEGRLLGVTLAAVAGVLQGISDRFEIVVVDDGSTDDTFAQIQSAHRVDPRIKGLRLSRRFGKEAALLAGLRHAQGQAVITLDADLQHPPEIMPDLYRAWCAGARIVHGIKVSGRSRNRLHGSLSRLFNTVFTRLSGFDLTMASDYKLLDRQVVRILVEQLPERSRFMRGLSGWVGFRQASVPFAVPARLPEQGHSRWGYGILTVYALQSIAAFSFLPLAIIPLLGVLLWMAALVLGGWGWLANQAISGVTFLGMIILFSSGSILLGLGIMSQYLANMYRELQHRPPFLIAETIGLTAVTPD